MDARRHPAWNPGRLVGRPHLDAARGWRLQGPFAATCRPRPAPVHPWGAATVRAPPVATAPTATLSWFPPRPPQASPPSDAEFGHPWPHLCLFGGDRGGHRSPVSAGTGWRWGRWPPGGPFRLCGQGSQAGKVPLPRSTWLHFPQARNRRPNTPSKPSPTPPAPPGRKAIAVRYHPTPTPPRPNPDRSANRLPLSRATPGKVALRPTAIDTGRSLCSQYPSQSRRETRVGTPSQAPGCGGDTTAPRRNPGGGSLPLLLPQALIPSIR